MHSKAYALRVLAPSAKMVCHFQSVPRGITPRIYPPSSPVSTGNFGSEVAQLLGSAPSICERIRQHRHFVLLPRDDPQHASPAPKIEPRRPTSMLSGRVRRAPTTPTSQARSRSARPAPGIPCLERQAPGPPAAAPRPRARTNVERPAPSTQHIHPVRSQPVQTHTALTAPLFQAPARVPARLRPDGAPWAATDATAGPKPMGACPVRVSARSGEKKMYTARPGSVGADIDAAIAGRSRRVGSRRLACAPSCTWDGGRALCGRVRRFGACVCGRERGDDARPGRCEGGLRVVRDDARTPS